MQALDQRNQKIMERVYNDDARLSQKKAAKVGLVEFDRHQFRRRLLSERCSLRLHKFDATENKGSDEGTPRRWTQRFGG